MSSLGVTLDLIIDCFIFESTHYYHQLVVFLDICTFSTDTLDTTSRLTHHPAQSRPTPKIPFQTFYATCVS